MQTKSVLQASANVIRVVNLKVGDVYKRIDSRYSDKELRYGIVQGIYNDGESTHFEALEYKKDWSDIQADYKIFSGEDDLALYPTTVEEIKEHFSSAIQSLEKKLKDKKEEVAKLEHSVELGQKFISGEMQKELSVIDYKEQSQEEFNEQKRLKEQRLKELASE